MEATIVFNLFKQQEIPGVSVGAKEIKERLDKGEKINFLDVREDWEREIAKIEGSKWIPVNEIEQRRSELNPQEETIVYCKGGGRSMKAVKTLQKYGFSKLKNLTGGIIAWSEEADPSLPKY